MSDPTLADARTLITVDQAGRQVGAGRTTIRRWIARGLPTIPYGKQYRVRIEDVRAWMAEHVPDWGTPAYKPWAGQPPKPDNRPGVVYAICDPSSRAVRYIGKAHDFRKRRRDHLADLKRGRHRNRHLQAWASKLGRAPIIRVLQECLPGMLDQCEQEWIARAKVKGWKLCNHLEGGNGGPHSDATRERLREIGRRKWGDPEYQRRHEEHRARRKGMTVEQYRQWQAERQQRHEANRQTWLANMAKAAGRQGRKRPQWTPATASKNRFKRVYICTPQRRICVIMPR